MPKPSTISQCMLNAAAMMETDANQYTAPQELTKAQRKSIAACNEGQAKLLRQSAEMADELVAAAKALMLPYNRILGSGANPAEDMDLRQQCIAARERANAILSKMEQ